MWKSREHIVKNKVQYYKLGAITHTVCTVDAKIKIGAIPYISIYCTVAWSIKNRMQYQKCNVK